MEINENTCLAVSRFVRIAITVSEYMASAVTLPPLVQTNSRGE